MYSRLVKEAYYWVQVTSKTVIKCYLKKLCQNSSKLGSVDEYVPNEKIYQEDVFSGVVLGLPVCVVLNIFFAI
jgi:hypothetical protein